MTRQKTIKLEDLSKASLIKLIKDRGLALTQRDLAYFKWEELSERGQQLMDRALREMGTKQSRPALLKSQETFDQGMKLSVLADIYFDDYLRREPTPGNAGAKPTPAPDGDEAG